MTLQSSRSMASSCGSCNQGPCIIRIHFFMVKPATNSSKRIICQFVDARVPAKNLLLCRVGWISQFSSFIEVPLHGRLFAQWMHHVYPQVSWWYHINGRHWWPEILCDANKVRNFFGKCCFDPNHVVECSIYIHNQNHKCTHAAVSNLHKCLYCMQSVYA